MKIVVCIKQVPDTTEIKLDPVTGTLIRDGVPSIMNPDDKGGLEFALQLKDQYLFQLRRGLLLRSPTTCEAPRLTYSYMLFQTDPILMR